MKFAVAIDGSENAVRAAHYAIHVAKNVLNTEVEMIYVVDHNKSKDHYLLSQSAESLALQREQKFKPVVEYANKHRIKTTRTLLKGIPSEALIRYVNDSDIDQLFIGSRGLNAFQEMLVGSVSQKVMKYVTCPVTLVK